MNQNKEIKRLEEKVSKDKKLTFLEEDEYCRREFDKTFNIDNLSDAYCSNYKFMFLLGRYLSDLTFSSNNYVETNLDADITKVNVHNLNNRVEPFNEIAYFEKHKEMLKNGLLKLIDANTIKREKIQLEKYAEEWDEIISIKNHPDQHLQRICKHASDGRKKVKNLFENGKISFDDKKHQLNLNLWKTKWVYIEASKIAEPIKAASEFPYKLTLKGKKIFYTFDSLIHIVNRHFGHQLSNTLLIKKSTHTVIIDPQNMHLQLERFFNEFEKCDLLTQDCLVPNNPLNFEYLSKKYQLYFKKFHGLFQVDSLYPLENEVKLQRLENYDLIQLNDELGLYVRK